MEAYFIKTNETGARRVVVLLTRGPKWVSVLYQGTLAVWRFTASDFDRAIESEVTDPAMMRRIVRRINERAKSYRQLGIGYAKKTVKRLLEGEVA